MSQHQAEKVDRPVWASPLAITCIWATVVAFAVLGVIVMTTNGDLGGVLLLTALILAAPAQAASQLTSRA